MQYVYLHETRWRPSGSDEPWTNLRVVATFQGEGVKLTTSRQPQVIVIVWTTTGISHLHTPLTKPAKNIAQKVSLACEKRSTLRFFQRTLAAARGDASSEQRSCSICLEEDCNEVHVCIQPSFWEVSNVYVSLEQASG